MTVPGCKLNRKHRLDMGAMRGVVLLTERKLKM